MDELAFYSRLYKSKETPRLVLKIGTLQAPRHCVKSIVGALHNNGPFLDVRPTRSLSLDARPNRSPLC
eukprot:COSAG05_NODE_1556_length_4568_cov_2.886776_3_plen_68_part_00